MTFASCFTTDNRLNWRAYAALFILCMGFFLPGFFTLPVLDRDEPHFAQATKQMLETGNYTDIRFQKEPRYKKPVGIYWLQAAAVKLLSPEHLDEIWAYRIPSLIGATVAILLSAALGALLFGPMAGFAAGLMLLCCTVLGTEARIAKTDAMLLASTVAAQFALARVYIKREMTRRQNLLNALLFWSAQGLAILIKGPITPLITLATLLTLRRSEKNLAWFKNLSPLLGIPYALLLVAPWFFAISAASHGAFVQEAGGQDLLAKLWQGQDRGIIPPGAHFLALIGVFFPASLYILLALPDIWRNRAEPRIRFLLGWIVPAWIIFELALTKLPHYVMPLYPALAILAAHFMTQGLPALTERKFRWLPPLVIGLWFVIGTGFFIGATMLYHATNGAWNFPIIAVGLILLTAMTASIYFLPRRDLRSPLTLTLGSMIFFGALFGNVLPNLHGVWLSDDMMKAIRAENICVHPQIAAAVFDEPSLIFLGGTQTIASNNTSLTTDALLNNPCAVAIVDDAHIEQFNQIISTSTQTPLINIGHFSGYNIGGGRHVELTLFRLAPHDQ